MRFVDEIEHHFALDAFVFLQTTANDCVVRVGANSMGSVRTRSTPICRCKSG
jgi:hypothetical protein